MTAASRGTLARFGALSGFYFATVGLFNPYAPLWFQSLGFSTLLIGIIASLQSWTRVLAPYGWSWAADHGGQHARLIGLAAAGALASALGLLGVRSAVPVAVMTALLFIANSGIAPLTEALLLQHLGTAQGVDPARYGRVRVWGSVGFIASVSAFGFLLEGFGIGIFPYFVAAMNALLLAAALNLPSARSASHTDEAAPPVLPLLRQPAVAWFFASIFFTVLAHTSLYAFFSLYLVELGYGKSAVGALWAVSVVVEILFFWFQGRWFARWTAHGWLKIVALVTMLRFALTAGGGAWTPALVLAQAAHAITFAAHHSACIELVHRHFPGRARGRGQALYTMLGYGLPGVLGGAGGGWVISHFGFAAVFWAATASAGLAWACAWLSQRAPGVKPVA